jgi:hypothetical protein
LIDEISNACKRDDLWFKPPQFRGFKSVDASSEVDVFTTG